MTAIGESIVVEDISGKGAAYVDRLEDAGGKDLVAKEEKSEKALKMIEGAQDFKGIPEKLERLDSLFETNGTWKRLGENCTNCAYCTAVCPTCHCCFIVEDIIEMVSEDMGESAMEYDPCMLNIALSEGRRGTRPRGYQRLKRLLLDKF